MKYARLTMEQFLALENEFIRFLATQSITGPEWEQIKKNKPEVAEAELDVFSDLIWEGVLAKVRYLENTNAQQCFLFGIADNGMELIHIKIKDKSKDLNNPEDLAWVCNNMNHRSISVKHGQKKFMTDKHQEIFRLLQQGAQITEGTYFEAIRKVF
ncbi:MAG: DUF6495 family protein [Gilvibacter sp.]